MVTYSHHVDWNQLRELGNRGIRRASVFMGIGTNAARQVPRVSHVLEGSPFVVVPSAVSEEVQSQFSDTFEQWVVSNGLREIVETLSSFLIEAFKGAYILNAGSSADALEFQKAVSKFDRVGVEKQLARISEMLALDGRFLPMFGSLNIARNCLSHRRGIIGREDEQAPGAGFVLTWRTRSLRREDGTDLTLAIKDGQAPRVEAGERLIFEEVERTRHLTIGQEIHLTQHELSEICLGSTIAIGCVVDGLINLVRSKGFTVNMTPEPPVEFTLVEE
jgi:hypothetical protein